MSSDGPNVNLKFLDNLREQRRDQNLKELLEIGTCGLHIVHNAFKHGGKASGWSIDKILAAMYKIFDQAASRRGDYERLTKGVYPLQFVSHRWAENQIVAERAIEVWEDIVTVVKYWMSLPKNKQPHKDNKSFPRLVSAITDPLMICKFKFFAATAKILNKFLLKFQTDKPMVPFLAHALDEIIRNFCTSFLLKETLDNAKTCRLLSKVKFTDPSVQKRASDVDPGIVLKLELSYLRKNGKITENQVLKFKRDITSYLSELCVHLAEKSPVKFSLTRNCRCFIPALLIETPDVCQARYGHVLENLLAAEQISEGFVEEAKQEFPKFLRVCKENRQDFLNFDSDNDRLDTFYWSHIENMKSIEKVAEVLKIVLTLSHGQASVERGFSVNKSLLVENLSAKSLISQRIVYDHMNFHNLTPENFIINPALRKSVRNARNEYEKYLEEKRKEKLHSEKDLKRKAIQEEIVAVKRKKTILEKTVVDLSKDADQYALDAENADEKEDIKLLLSKSNSFRRTANQKKRRNKRMCRAELMRKKTT